jgi:spore maturation protein CgeB
MKILMTWHYNSDIKEFWSTPQGIYDCFLKMGYHIDRFPFNPNNCDFSKVIEKKELYDLFLIFYAGPSEKLSEEIQKVKNSTKLKIILELGDEPQTFHWNQERAKVADAVLTPDLRCYNQYKQNNINVYWMTHWGDEQIFYPNPKIKKQNVCVTTCGHRNGVDYIQSSLKEKFVNQRISCEKNNEFYNSGTVGFQCCNFDEITRRIFEIGGSRLALVLNRISPETGIYDLLIDGEDVLYYSTPQEAVDKINLLLNDFDLREKLSYNLYNKVENKHRAIHRCQKIIRVYDSL